MRTSNKILLATFLAAILVLSFIHIALYAMYKNGHYTTLKAIEEDNFIHHSIKNITRVEVTGIEDVNIISSDTAKLDIQKDEDGFIRFEIKDGTLIIRGDTIIRKQGEPDNVQRSYQDINIYLPSLEKISADNSTIYIRGSKDSSSAKSYEIDLQNGSSFDFHDVYDRDSTNNYFKNFVIHSNNSDVGFNRLTVISNLQLSLKESSFFDNAANIGKIKIQLDSLSKINMQGSNLQKAAFEK